MRSISKKIVSLAMLFSVLFVGVLAALAAKENPKAFKWSDFAYPKAIDGKYGVMDTGNEEDQSYTFYSTAKRDSILAHYRKKINAIGWRLTNDFLVDEGGFIVAQGGEDIVNIVVFQDGKRMKVQILHVHMYDEETAALAGNDYELYMRGADPEKAPGIHPNDAGLSWMKPEDGLPWKELTYPKSRVIGYGNLPDVMLGTEGFPSMTLYTSADIKDIQKFYKDGFAKLQFVKNPVSISAGSEGAELFELMGVKDQLWYYSAEKKDVSVSVAVFQSGKALKRVRISFVTSEA